MRAHTPPPWLLPVVTLCRHATIPFATRTTPDEELDAQVEMGEICDLPYVRCVWLVGRVGAVLSIDRGRVHVQWEATGGDMDFVRAFAPALLAVVGLADACEALMRLPTAPPPT